MSKGVVVRRGVSSDVPSLLEIYNYEVVNGASTLDLNPRTLAEWESWFASHQNDLHPLFVAEVDGAIAGYASLSSYRPKEAYRSTVELSVYVHHDMRGRGVATSLMDELLAHAQAHEEIHLVVSIITSQNKASVHLHDKYGFQPCGVVHEVGFKLGEYHDILMFELFV